MTMDAFRALGREYSVEILEAAGEPKSAQQLSEELDVPIATCYRRINELAENGLLEECERRGERSGRETLYRRTVDAVTVEFAPSLSVATKPRDRIRAAFDTAWRTLAEG